MDREILLENIGLRDINPLLCGEAHNEPGRQVGPYVREHTLLHFIVGGSGLYYSPRGVTRVTEGQLFIIRPGETTIYTNDPEDPWHYIWVGFTCGMPPSGLFGADVVDIPEAKHLFLDIAGADNIEHGRELYICGKLYELIALMRAKEAPSACSAQRYARMARNYIDLHYSGDLKVERIAEQLCIDRAYFSKLFHQYMGKSPQQYIVDLRLSKAAALLSSQSLSPGEAAQKVGYGDFSNFSRMFKRRYGMAPSQYRSAQRSITNKEGTPT